MSADLEARVLNFVIDRMQIDDEWFEWEGRGFRWWAGPLAQRLRFAPRRDVDGVTMATLHIETDLLADVPMTGATWQRLAAVNRLATLSAYVADVPARSVSLHASVSFTGDNWLMARGLALHAVALQNADAHAEAAEMAAAFEARVRASEHGTRGRRKSHDEMLGIVEVYQHRGQDPPPIGTAELAQLVHLEPRPWLMAANEPNRLLADLDFATGRPARLELDAGVIHPALGTGLQVRLVLPVEPDPALSQRLNANEALSPDAHQLGAWCIDPDHGLAFIGFFPSAACLPELGRALVYHAAGRNEWAREVLFPQ